jgi:thioredoxin:protein disulfide reductase
MLKVALYILLNCLFSMAYADSSALSASQAFQLRAEVSTNQELILKWDIAPGYYLYKDKIVLAPAEDQSLFGKLQWPTAEKRYDEVRGHYQVYSQSLTLTLPLISPATAGMELKVSYQGCSSSGYCYATQTKLIKIKKALMNNSLYADISADTDTKSITQPDYAAMLLANQHYSLVMLGFLALGLLLAFTPCVLPMVPILSSIIVGYGRNIGLAKAFSLSLAYVLGSSIAYALAGIFVALAGSHVQIYLQQPWVIILFSSLFVLLALSLFECYQFKLPNSWQQRLVNWSHKHKGGTYISVFFMGSFSTLIVSPCVSAPLVGVLAYIGNSGDVVLGGLALWSLGLGMGLPLLLIGTSAGKLLPKSGPWMDRVKQLFGLLMLGLAIWMLARILPGAVILFLWSMLAVAVAVFIWQVKHAKKIWHKVQQSFGLLLLSYGFILMGGAFFGKSDPLYIAYLFNHNIQTTADFTIVNNMSDLDKKLIEAKQNNKSVLLDFYADWCASCKLMDKHIFARPDIKQALKDYVLLRADITQNTTFDQALLKKFNVVAPPTMIFFNDKGMLQEPKVVGEINAKEFLSYVNKLKLPDNNVKICQANIQPC